MSLVLAERPAHGDARGLLVLHHGRGTSEQEHHLHESPPSMTMPLIVLAFLSIVGGWVGLPAVFGGCQRLTRPFRHCA